MVPSPASGDLSRQTFSNCSLSSTWSRLAATSVTVTRSVQEYHGSSEPTISAASPTVLPRNM